MRLLVLLVLLLRPAPPQSSVYICTGSYAERYHASAECRGLNACKGKTVRESLEEAQKDGRTPCHICVATSVEPVRVSSGGSDSGTSGQCTAITKKGTRCSRSARSGGRCWQHGG